MGTTAEGLPYPEGSPGALRRAGDDIRTLLGDLFGARSTLAGGAGPSGWEGGASTAYTALVNAHTEAIDQAATELSGAADQVESLADVLDRAQNRIKDLDDEVREAREAAEAAALTASRARTALAKAQAAADSPLLTSGLGSMDPADRAWVAAEGAYNRAATAAGIASGTYEQVKDDAMQRAQELVDDVDDADVRTGSALTGVSFVAAPDAGTTPSAPSSSSFDFDCPLDNPYVKSFLDGLGDASSRSNIYKQFQDGAPLGPLFEDDVRQQLFEEGLRNPAIAALNDSLGTCIPDPLDNPYPPKAPPPPPPAPQPVDKPLWPDDWPTPADAYREYDETTDRALDDVEQWLDDQLPAPNEDPNGLPLPPFPVPRPGPG